MQERKNPLSFTLQQVAEIISTTRGDRHRSTVRDKQLCCHWNGNMIPFVVLYHGTYQAFSPDLPFSHTDQSFPLLLKKRQEGKKNQVSPFQGQEMDENSAPGERNKLSSLNSILPSSALCIRGTSAQFKTWGLAPESQQNPNQKWHVLLQVKMTLAWTCACASCSCWKLKPATVLLHFPGCSQVSFWFCLSKSGLKENKTNKSTQELVYPPTSEAKEQRHNRFILSNPYHNLHSKIFKIHSKSCLCSVTPAYALPPPLAVNVHMSHSSFHSPRSYSHFPSV